MSDPSVFLMPEPLHHWHKQFWDHDAKWCINGVGAAELDFCFSILHQLVGSQHFNEGIWGWLLIFYIDHLPSISLYTFKAIRSLNCTSFSELFQLQKIHYVMTVFWHMHGILILYHRLTKISQVLLCLMEPILSQLYLCTFSDVWNKLMMNLWVIYCPYIKYEHLWSSYIVSEPKPIDVSLSIILLIIVQSSTQTSILTRSYILLFLKLFRFAILWGLRSKFHLLYEAGFAKFHL